MNDHYNDLIGSVLQYEKAEIIQAQLFVSGVSTLLQSLFGTRLPSVAAGSYAYVLPVTSILSSGRYSSIADPREVYQTARCFSSSTESE